MPTGSNARVDARQLRENLVEILESYPVLGGNPEECPLLGARTTPSELRGRWVNTLSDDELRYLVAYHHVCLRTKVEPQAR